jgi:hypothetical protein
MWKWMTKKAVAQDPPEPQYSNRSRGELDDDGFPERSRTVGLYDARLRAANKEAWTTSSKGWSEILGRFSSKSK